MSVGIDKLASELQKVIEEKDKNKKTPYDTEAEVVRVDTEVVWVKIPGGVDETPAQKTINAKVGDRVQVRVSGGRAFLVGNGTNPPTDDTVANVAICDARDANQNATAAGMAAEQAIESANTANEKAYEASVAAAQAQTDAGIAHTAANEAKADAAAANTAAIQAKADAAAASTAAGEAKTAANEAKADAQAANTAATEAKADAARANTAANDSLSQLSIVEDVVGTLNWITTHATYKASADTEVHAGKWYFTKSGDTYNVVTNPAGNPSSKGYYEVDTIDEAVSNYVASHLTLTSDGLYLTKDGNGYKILLANDGLKVYDPEGHLVSTFGESIILDSSRPQTIGNNNVYIKYYDKNNDGTPDSLAIKADEFLLSSGKTIQEELEGVENWFYSVAPTTSNEPAKNWTTDKLKEQHLRDIYFDTTSGKSYRWAKDGTTYKWVEIEDVELAALAKDLHDNYPPRSEFTVAPDKIQSTVSAAQTAATNAANTATDNKLKSYYTKTQTDSQIEQTANSITSTVSSTYETKTDASAKLTEAKGDATTKANQALTDAKADTTEKLKSYSTTTQMNSAIEQKANSIALSVSEEKIAELISTKEVSGSIVHVEDASEYPALDCKISLEPIQDLNGYDAPWVGGAGVNLFPYLNAKTATFNGVTFSCDGKGTLTMQGTATANDYASLTFPQAFVIPDGADYKFCMLNTEAHADSVLRFVNGSTIVDSWSPNPVNREATYAGMSGKTVTGIRLYCAQGETYNLTMKPMFVPKTETVTGYIPYENICPISGRTEVVTQRTGKNMLNLDRALGTPNPSAGSNTTSPRVMDTEHYYVGLRHDNYYYPNNIAEYSVANNEVTVRGANNAYGVGFPIEVKPNTQYKVSATVVGSGYLGITYYDAQWHYISFNNGLYEFTTPSNASYAVILLRSLSTSATATWKNVQVELGTTATDYEPYQGDTHDITFPTEAGTVYGGTLDVTTGVLTVDKAMATLVGGNWSKSSSYPGGFYIANGRFPTAFGAPKPKDKTPLICSHASTAKTLGEYVNGTCYSDQSTNIRIMSADTTASEWLQYLVDQNDAGTPVQVCYELATPQTYQLTPQQISLLVGENNLWSDSGDTYLKYITMNSDMLSLMDKSNADLSRAKAEIKVTTDGISSEVAKKVGDSEIISKINQSAETVQIEAEKIEFKGSVVFNAIKSETDAAYDAKGAASTVQTNLDNLKIGGRNLVWDTEWNHISTRWSNWGSPTTREIVTINGKRWLHLVTTSTSYQGYSQAQDKRNGYGEIKAGDKVVISYSAYAKTAGQKCTVGCHWRNSSGTTVAQNWFASTLTTTEKRYTSGVFTIPNDAVGFNVMVGDGTANAQELWISQVKIEFGTKATDWSPAPEDIQSNAEDYADNAAFAVKTELDATKIDVVGESTSLLDNINAISDQITLLASRINFGNITVADNLAQLNTAVSIDTVTSTVYVGDQSSFHVRINGTELGFYQGSQRVAYINNNQLYITQSVVLQQMDLGIPVANGGLGQWSWKVHPNGQNPSRNNLNLKWIG